MKAKKIVTGLLLGFVGLSLAWLAAGEVFRPAGDEGAPKPLAVETAKTDSPAAGSEVLVAYYFFGNVRCVTCQTMEAYATEAIESGFGEELAAGRVQWKALNLDEPANEHFTTDFNLATRSLVLARVKDGAVADYRNLEAIWTLAGDKPAFIEYVQTNAREMLSGSGS